MTSLQRNPYKLTEILHPSYNFIDIAGCILILIQIST